MEERRLPDSDRAQFSRGIPIFTDEEERKAKDKRLHTSSGLGKYTECE